MNFRPLGRVAATVLAAAILAGCGGAGDTKVSGETHTVTSPDGTITIALPVEWSDLSADYLGAQPDSVLSAYWSTGSRVSEPITPFATVSTRPVDVATGTASAEDRAAVGADAWTDTLDGTIVDEGGFTTDAGDDGYWFRVDGQSDGLDTTIFSISIVGEERTAKILIETYAAELTGVPYATALVDALPSVEFSPLSAAELAQGEVDGGLYTLGTLSAEVPPAWTAAVPEADLRSIATGEEAQLLGLWAVESEASGGATVFSVVVKDAPPTGALRDLDGRRDEYGEIGVTQEYPDGTVTPTSWDKVKLAPGRVAGRGCATVLTEEIGTPYSACTYWFNFEDYFGVATAQAATLTDDALAEFEALLASIAAAA